MSYAQPFATRTHSLLLLLLLLLQGPRDVSVLTASHSLQAMHRSSPVGYRLNACSPLNLGLMAPFSNGYIICGAQALSTSHMLAQPRA